MIKDVHINNPSPVLSGIEFRSGAAYSGRDSEIADILEAVVAGKNQRSQSGPIRSTGGTAGGSATRR